MANLTYSTAIQNRIAAALWNVAYSSLTAQQKIDVDGTWTSGALSTGRAFEAFKLVTQLGQWIELTDATAVSDAAEIWFVDEVCYRLARTHRPERLPEFRDSRNESRAFYFDTVSTTILTTGYAGDVFTLTAQAIRYYVLRRIISFKPGMSTFPSPEEIDGVTFDMLNWFWNSRQWNFRRRLVTITIPTASNGASPTIGLASGETFDQLATRELYYGQSNGVSECAVWATADEMAQLKAISSTATGKPTRFRIERSNNTYSWIWDPYPDQEYTVKAEVLIALPGTTTPGVWDSATDTVPFAKVPAEFRGLFKELVCGAVMKARNLGDQVWKEAMDKFERGATTQDDHGEADLNLGVRDVYRDRSAQQFGVSLYGYRGGM